MGDGDGDAGQDERLKRLEARIAEAKKAHAPEPPQDKPFGQAELAWRMVTELVAGLLIGFGIGYGLDAVFHTRPVFLVLFILAGLAAGVRVMLRTAEGIAKRAADAAEDKAAKAARGERD